MRKIEKDKSIWNPKPSDKVCSDHFIGGKLTTANPDPNLLLFYEKPFVKPGGVLD